MNRVCSSTNYATIQHTEYQDFWLTSCTIFLGVSFVIVTVFDTCTDKSAASGHDVCYLLLHHGSHTILTAYSVPLVTVHGALSSAGDRGSIPRGRGQRCLKLFLQVASIELYQATVFFVGEQGSSDE